jgi:hypothetical protein
MGIYPHSIFAANSGNVGGYRRHVRRNNSPFFLNLSIRWLHNGLYRQSHGITQFYELVQ